jgi:hypothetical protein
MKRAMVSALFSAITLAALPAALRADIVDNFIFTGNDGMDATGTITISGTAAVSGTISVTGVPVEASPSTLISTAGALIPNPVIPSAFTLINHDGDDMIYDNVILPGDPILDDDGLGFASGPFQDSTHYETLINLWGNGSPGSYHLFVAEANVDGDGNVIGDPQYVYANQDGSLTLIPGVGAGTPEPAALSLLSLGALTLLARRTRK